MIEPEHQTKDRSHTGRTSTHQPAAVIPHAGICEEAARQLATLPNRKCRMKPIVKIASYCFAAWMLWTVILSAWKNYSAVDSEAALRAAASYSDYQIRHEQTLPEEVSLSELISSGYLSASEVPVGAGIQRIQISTKNDSTDRTWIGLAFRSAELYFRPERQ